MYTHQTMKTNDRNITPFLIQLPIPCATLLSSILTCVIWIHSMHPEESSGIMTSWYGRAFRITGLCERNPRVNGCNNNNGIKTCSEAYPGAICIATMENAVENIRYVGHLKRQEAFVASLLSGTHMSNLSDGFMTSPWHICIMMNLGSIHHFHHHHHYHHHHKNHNQHHHHHGYLQPEIHLSCMVHHG